MHSELHDTSEAQGASGEMLPNVTFTATNVKLNAFRPINITPGDFQVRISELLGCRVAGSVYDPALAPAPVLNRDTRLSVLE